MPLDNEADTVTSEKLYKQLELYAKDLQELYWQEQQKRAELVEEKLVLQFKIKELEGLNRLFQSYLEQRAHLEEAYKRLVQEIKRVLSEEKDIKTGLQKLLADAEAQRPGS